MDATRLHLVDCVGVIVLPISRIIIASAYKELTVLPCFDMCSFNSFHALGRIVIVILYILNYSLGGE